MSYAGKTPTYDNVSESAPLDIVVAALDIDWALGDTYSKSIAAASTLTFSNDVNGKSIILAVTNTDTTDHAITLPVGVKSDLNYDGTVVNGTTTLFTFVKINNVVYVAEIKEIA